MNHRRRQQFNSVNAPALARWIVIFLFLAVTGLSYVYISVQLHTLGTRRKQLERDLAETHTQIEDARVQIAALTSRSAIQQRLREGSLKMIPISEENIVRLSPLPHRPNDDEVQPVANRQAAR